MYVYATENASRKNTLNENSSSVYAVEIYFYSQFKIHFPYYWLFVRDIHL